MQKRNAPPGRTSIVHEGIVKPCGPHQRTRRSGSVQALRTRRRGASKTRVRTSSRSADSVAALVLAAMFLLQKVVQAIEALLPEASVVFEPVRSVLERTRPEPAGSPLGLAAARDQAGALQHLEVLGDGGKAHLEGLGQLRDPGLARAEASKDRAPGGIGQGREGDVEAIGRHASVNCADK